MAIDNSRHKVFAGCVDHPGISAVQVFPYRGNLSIAYQHVSIRQCSVRYGEHGRIANECVRRAGATLREGFRQ